MALVLASVIVLLVVEAAGGPGGTCPGAQKVLPCSGPQDPAKHLRVAADPSVYEKTVRPPCGNGTYVGPTIVEVQLYVSQLNGVNEKLGLVTLNGYLRQWWQDPRLAFNDTTRGGCFDSIKMFGEAADSIWMPDIYVDNLFKADHTGEAKLTQISADGSIWRSEQVLLTVKTPLDLTMLPYDSHVVMVTVASYSQDTSEMRLVPRGGRIGAGRSGVGLKAPLLDHSVWEMTEGVKDDGYETPGLVENMFSWDYVSFVLHFRRRPKFYVECVLFPAIVFSLIAYCQFFVDARAAPARAALAIMPVLIMRTMQNSVYDTLPQGSQRMWLGDFLFVSQCLVIGGAFELAFVQFYVQMESRRAQKLQGLSKVKRTIESLIRQQHEEGTTLLKMLKRFEPQEVQVDCQEFAMRRSRFLEKLSGTKNLTTIERLRRSRSANASVIVKSGEVSPGLEVHKASSADAKEHSVREADLLFIVYARNVFMKCDWEGDNRLFYAEFRNALSHFNVYTGHTQAASVMAMFSRDIGETTPLNEKTCYLTFSQFTRFLLCISDYEWELQKSSLSFFCLRDYVLSCSPSQRCDTFAKVSYPFAMAVQLLCFYLLL